MALEPKAAYNSRSWVILLGSRPLGATFSLPWALWLLHRACTHPPLFVHTPSKKEPPLQPNTTPMPPFSSPSFHFLCVFLPIVSCPNCSYKWRGFSKFLPVLLHQHPLFFFKNVCGCIRFELRHAGSSFLTRDQAWTSCTGRKRGILASGPPGSPLTPSYKTGLFQSLSGTKHSPPSRVSSSPSTPSFPSLFPFLSPCVPSFLPLCVALLDYSRH